jgi:hypothetical protein
MRLTGIFMELIAMLFPMAALAAGSDVKNAHQSCPPGLFLSAAQQKCARVHSSSVLPLDETKPMKFEALQVSLIIIWIQATGTITADTPAEFERFLNTYDAKLSKNIYFHSPGGNLIAGMKLGEMIRKAGYNTGIGRSILLDGAVMDVYSYNEAHCASACAYAFLGGVTRSYREKEKYGLHRFGSTEKLSTDEAQIITSLIAAYIERMGANQAILQLASVTPFEGDIFWVPTDVARQMKVIFDPSGKAEFRIERRGQRTVALFDFTIREKRYEGMVMCGNDTPMLAIFDLTGSMPKLLQLASDFPAQFSTGEGGTIQARASYFSPAAKGGPSYMLFTMPGLRASMFEGEGLSLNNIWNPVVEAQAAGKIGTDAFLTKVKWVDAVTAYPISIAANNASRTLPILLDNCR